MDRFQNPHLPHTRRSLWAAFLWWLGHYNDPAENVHPPASFAYPATPSPCDPKKCHATWIGHSTYFVEMEGVRFLTDPVWGDYCAPIPIPKLKRKCEPPICLSDLPQIDFILLSHNHYDHLDAKVAAYLKRHQPHITWIVPEKLSRWFQKRGISNVRELKWWESGEASGLTITAVPAQHFSGRTLWDTNKTHWNGYAVTGVTKKLYFTGDTGYNPYDFKAIGKKFQSFDLSLIPIGTYVPRKFMSPVHISPEEAVQIHQDVGSKFSLGMHWGTFNLSEEPMHAPPYDLYLAMREKNLPLATFLPIPPGTSVNW